VSHHTPQISGPRKDATSKKNGGVDQDAELPSIQRAASKGAVQLLGHANHKPISKTREKPSPWNTCIHMMR
jgi:hypothetical protein